MSLHAVYRLRGAEAGHGIRGRAGVAHITLEQEHGVLVRTLRGRELVLELDIRDFPPSSGESWFCLLAPVLLFSLFSLSKIMR